MPKELKYIYGPISVEWLSKASKSGGAYSFQVAVILIGLSNLYESNTFPINKSIVEKFNIKRKGFYKAIQSLEKDGLIFVDRHPGRNHQISILQESMNE